MPWGPFGADRLHPTAIAAPRQSGGYSGRDLTYIFFGAVANGKVSTICGHVPPNARRFSTGTIVRMGISQYAI